MNKSFFSLASGCRSGMTSGCRISSDEPKQEFLNVFDERDVVVCGSMEVSDEVTEKAWTRQQCSITVKRRDKVGSETLAHE